LRRAGRLGTFAAQSTQEDLALIPNHPTSTTRLSALIAALAATCAAIALVAAPAEAKRLAALSKSDPHLDRLPPFHPNCRYALLPAHVSFEQMEAAPGRGPDVDSPAGSTEIGLTPYRGTGTATGEDYYSTPRFKGFERKVQRQAKSLGLGYDGMKRARGVWAGGGEPSTVIGVRGERSQVRGFMDLMGSEFNQDAVISWERDPEGPHLKYRSTHPLLATDDAIEQAIAKVSEELPEDEQIQGATRGPEGHLEIIDLSGTLPRAIAALSAELEATFGYRRGRGELRFKGDNYPGGGRG
jgi:hypothetical protein